MDSILTLEKVCKVYEGAIPTQVLFDIDLAFEKGSFNGVIGQSGSGKSTLMNIMGTLDRPTTGDVRIAGRETAGMSAEQLARLRNESIGFVFQFHYLLPEFTALENVLMPYLIKHDRASKEIRERAVELMDRVGLSAVRDNPSAKMSGGQQQRTAIARALIMNPAIVLADEPTGNLDSESAETVYEILRGIHDTMRTTFVVITHDRKIAEKTDRIIEIRDGRVALDVKKGVG